MLYRSLFSEYFLLVVYAVLATIGIFQAGYLIGLAAYSDTFSVSSLNLLQVSLLGLGSWGAFELIRMLKKVTRELQ